MANIYDQFDSQESVPVANIAPPAPEEHSSKWYLPNTPQASKAANIYDQFDAPNAELASLPPINRSWSDVGKDIGVVAPAKVLGDIIQLPGQLAGLVGGNPENNFLSGVTEIGKGFEKFGEENKSDTLKQREAIRTQRIAEAAKNGFFDEFKTVIAETATDPVLAPQFFTEQGLQMAPIIGFAKLAQAKTLARELAAGVSQHEAEATAAKVGMNTAIGIAAGEQGIQAGSETYEMLYKALIEKGLSPEQAKSETINKARMVGAGSAIVSVLAQFLPGGRELEKAFVGLPGTGGRFLTAGKAALGETLSENVEEDTSQIMKNIAMRTANPNQSLTENLGSTSAFATLGAAGMGGTSGFLRKPATSETAAIPTIPATPATPAATAVPSAQAAADQAVIDAFNMTEELHVPGRKHAGNAGLGCHALAAHLGLDIAGRVHIELAGKDGGVRFVANRDKAPRQGDVTRCTAGGGLDAHAGHAGIITQYFIERVIPGQLDLAFSRLGHQLVDQDCFGAKLVAAMDHRDLARDVG